MPPDGMLIVVKQCAVPTDSVLRGYVQVTQLTAAARDGSPAAALG